MKKFAPVMTSVVAAIALTGIGAWHFTSTPESHSEPPESIIL